MSEPSKEAVYTGLGTMTSDGIVHLRASREPQEWTITKDSHFAYMKSSGYGCFMFPVSEFDQLQQVTSCINAALAAEREKRKPLVEALIAVRDAPNTSLESKQIIGETLAQVKEK